MTAVLKKPAHIYLVMEYNLKRAADFFGTTYLLTFNSLFFSDIIRHKLIISCVFPYKKTPTTSVEKQMCLVSMEETI